MKPMTGYYKELIFPFASTKIRTIINEFALDTGGISIKGNY